jgi:phage-related protein (TIGR01555 family)
MEHRNDSILYNTVTGQGTERDKTIYTGVGIGWYLTAQEIEELYEHDWLCQQVVNVIVDESTREWISYDIGSEDGSAELIDAFIKYQDNLVDEADDYVGLSDIFSEAMKMARLLGGAIIYMDIDDNRERYLPVNEKNIKKINFLQVYDRYQVSPAVRCDLPEAVSSYSKTLFHDLSKPTHYELTNINGVYGLEKDRLIHASRCLRFDSSVRPSYRSRQRNQGWGRSVLQGFFNALKHYETAISGLSKVLAECSIIKHSVAGLWEKLTGGEGPAIAKRMEELDMMNSIYRRLVVDKDFEDVQIINASIQEFASAIEPLEIYLTGAAGLPRTLLFGQSPSGQLGESGGSEQRDIGRKIKAYQARHMDKPLRKLFDLLWLAKDSPTKGKIPGSFNWRFNDPYPMTEDELLNLQTKYSQIDATYSNIGVLMSDEIAKSRFAGSAFGKSIVLDWEKREKLERQKELDPVIEVEQKEPETSAPEESLTETAEAPTEET